MKVFACLIFLLNILFVVNLSAHDKTIKGRVLVGNGKDEPVVGAAVKLEGTVLGAITNSEGKFIIKGVPDGKFILFVSSIGMYSVRKDIELTHVEGDEFLIDIQMDENPIKVTNIVVTATRNEKIYDDIPIKVSTITQSDIQISSSNNLRESLQYQPGVRTEVNCQNCGFSQVRINGLDGKYSQILIDGRAIFSSLNGVYGLDQIPVNMIERVEIVRGGGSSLYGGNAVAGVINIITKSPAYNSFDISWNNIMIANKSPENVLTFNNSIISDRQNVGLLLYGMKHDRHEYDANEDGFSEIGRLNVLTFGSKMFYKINSQSKITAELNSISHKIRGGNKINAPSHEVDISESAEHKTLMGQISYEQFIGFANKLNVYLSFQNTDRNSYYGSNQDLDAYGRTDNQTISTGVNQLFFIDEFVGEHSIILGYEFNMDVMDDEAPSYERRIEQTTLAHGIYIQDDWMLNEKINFLLGGRLEKHNLIDNLIVNPRISILYKPLDNLSFRGNFSSGYRAPQAFDEDLHITQVGGEGLLILNADNLKPEFSNSYSTSIDYTVKLFGLPLAFSLEYFNTKLSDAFALVEKGNDVQGNRIFLRENSESAHVNGFTFEIESNYQDIHNLKFGATLQNSVYADKIEWSYGDEDLGIASQFSDKIFRTPNNYAYFLFNFKPYEKFNVNLSGYYTGSMYMPHYAGYIDNDKLEKTKSFFDMNAKVSYFIMNEPNLKLSIGVLNILNSYQDDFDKGVERDAGYIYGPFRPLSTYFKIRIYY